MQDLSKLHTIHITRHPNVGYYKVVVFGVEQRERRLRPIGLIDFKSHAINNRANRKERRRIVVHYQSPFTLLRIHVLPQNHDL